VDDHLAHLGEHLGAEIVGAGGGPGVENNDVVGGSRFEQGLFQQLRVIDHRQAATGNGAPFLQIAGEDARIEFNDLAGAWRTVRFDELAAGGDDVGLRRTLYEDLCHPGGKHSALVDGAYLVAFRQNEFGRHDILTNGPDMLPGSGGAMQLYLAFVEKVNVFDHHHRIAPLGDGIAGIHRQKTTLFQAYRLGLASTSQIKKMQGNAVHGRSIIRRRGAQGKHRFGGNAAEAIVDTNAFFGLSRKKAVAGQGFTPQLFGFGKGFVADIDVSLVHV